MNAWAKDQGVAGSDFITMLGDPSGKFTKELDMVLNHPGPMGVLGYERCKRFALYVVDGVIKIVRVAEAEDDPAGDDKPEVTLAPAMIDAITALTKSEL